MDYDLVGPDGRVYTLTHHNTARPNAIWRWSRDKVQKDMDQLVFKDGNVYTKNYEKAGGKPRSLFVDDRFGALARAARRFATYSEAATSTTQSRPSY